MSYVVVGCVCFILGALSGVCATALVFIHANTERVEPKEVNQRADR